MRTRTMLAAVLFAVLAAGIVRANASALGPVGGALSLASTDQVVLSPPVVVSAIPWETEFESVPPPAYRVRVLHIELTFTTDFLGPLMVKVTVTGDSPLPQEFYQITGNLDKLAGETEPFNFVMDSLNVPVAAVQDLYIMLCDHNPADGNTVCRLP